MKTIKYIFEALFIYSNIFNNQNYRYKFWKKNLFIYIIKFWITFLDQKKL